MIASIGKDPVGTVKDWRGADAPFSFVAGCIELAAAWQVGPGFSTRLPVCFDGSCSAIQHLAMLMRDRGAGHLVNLTAGDEPRDVYQVITDRVIAELNAVADYDDRARWWLGRHTIGRKLIKQPAMTFGYSVTQYGMKGQLVEAYRESARQTRADRSERAIFSGAH